MRAAAVGAIAALLSALPAAPANADPDAVTKAKAEVERLTTAAAAIDQDYASVQDKLAKARSKLSARSADLAEQEGRVAEMRTQAGRIALAHYQGRDVDPTAQLLFASDPASFLNRYATVEQITANQNSSLQDYQSEQANLIEMRRAAATQKADIAQDEKNLAELRASSQDKVEQAQAVYNRLSQAERERLRKQEEREAREATARAEAASSAASTDSADDSTTDARSKDTSRSSERTDVAATGSGDGAAALAFARKQIGKPYRYGGTGPGAFDCSGLTGAAWRAAGVSLPRTSQAQFGAGRAVSKSELQPGDLVFYYGGISHVGLYVGNGMILHASRPGKPIGYDSLDAMPYAGARRPG